MAANNKQYLIPGYGFIDEKNEDEQWMIPGYGFTDEEAPAAGGGTLTISVHDCLSDTAVMV